MRNDEAVALAELVFGSDAFPLDVALEIGSSTRVYRTVVSPHIEEIFRRALLKRCEHVYTVDIKNDPGVDFVGNILDPEFAKSLAKLSPDCLVITNLAEHLTNVELLEEAINLLPTVKTIVYSGPLDYPYHRDPIDNLVRLSVDDLTDLFPGFYVESGSSVKTGSYRNDLSTMTFLSSVRSVLRNFLVAAYLLLNGINIFRFSRLAFLWRPYSATCAVLRRNSASIMD
jgi:hypothetical protein